MAFIEFGIPDDVLAEVYFFILVHTFGFLDAQFPLELAVLEAVPPVHVIVTGHSGPAGGDALRIVVHGVGRVFKTNALRLLSAKCEGGCYLRENALFRGQEELSHAVSVNIRPGIAGDGREGVPALVEHFVFVFQVVDAAPDVGILNFRMCKRLGLFRAGHTGRQGNDSQYFFHDAMF